VLILGFGSTALNFGYVLCALKKYIRNQNLSYCKYFKFSGSIDDQSYIDLGLIVANFSYLRPRFKQTWSLSNLLSIYRRCEFIFFLRLEDLNFFPPNLLCQLTPQVYAVILANGCKSQIALHLRFCFSSSLRQFRYPKRLYSIPISYPCCCSIHPKV
jgi:hypothetical protein